MLILLFVWELFAVGVYLVRGDVLTAGLCFTVLVIILDRIDAKVGKDTQKTYKFWLIFIIQTVCLVGSFAFLHFAWNKTQLVSSLIATVLIAIDWICNFKKIIMKKE